ncbi:DUF6069 family protein [Nocardioides sp.]|uniref:DUF6069 family protein n=1 Tax=Nocardioides sp. TaxID=35761 RepID=UPI0026112673|nr:DUF6069 family protein [Nocardioides sp.]MCW2737282.1 hypothetical protein [Nocardioides sp.]
MIRRLVVPGLLATVAASVVTALVAAVARAAGVELEVGDPGEQIPVSGIAVVTAFFSVVGVALAAALLRWSAHPAERFVQAALALTALSLAPPVLYGTGAAAVGTLIGLHLVAAAVMIPVLAVSLNRPAASRGHGG